MNRYPGEDFDDYVDRVTDEAIQRDLDDAMEAKRNAAGASIETLLMQDAFLEGQRAGRLGLAPALNPWQEGTKQYDAWERGRSAFVSARLNGYARRVA